MYKKRDSGNFGGYSGVESMKEGD